MKLIFLFFSFLFITIIGRAQWVDETNFGQVISDLHSFNNELHIVGGFTSRNGGTCYWSTYYDGSNFVNQTSMLGGTGLNRLEVFNSELYATGALNIAGTMGVYKWSGASWNSAASLSSSHTGIYADANDLYVGSDFGVISKKTGTGGFSSLPLLDNTNDDVRAINKFNGEIIIAGQINTYNAVALNKIARFDGVAWQPLGAGLNGSARCLAVYNSELYVGGDFSTAGGQPAKYIAKWNGSTWSSVGGSMTGTGYNGIRDMVVYNNKLYVVGDFTAMGGVTTKYVAMWNGSSWTSIDMSISSSFANCVEVYNNRLYVGTFNFTDSHLYSIDMNTIGIDDNTKNNTIKFFPNPNNGKFNVEIDNNQANSLIEVYNIIGNLVFIQNSDDIKTTIDIKDQPQGIYLVKITVDNQVFNEKVIKN